MNKVSPYSFLVIANDQAISDALPFANSQEATIEERTEGAAKKAFKCYGCWEKFCATLKKIALWIKNIPSKITECFNKCLATKEEVDIDYSDDEDDYEREPVQIPEHLLQEYFKKDIKPDVFKEFLHELSVKAEIFHNQVNTMKFDPNDKEGLIEELTTLDNLDIEIRVNVEIISELKKFYDTSETQEIKNIADEHLKILSINFTKAQNDLKSKVEANEKTIADIREAKAILDAYYAKQANRQNVNKTSKATYDKQAIHAGKAPPTFEWSGNNCWYHSALIMFWAMGDLFHRLVQQKNKAENRKLMTEEYNQQLQAYNKLKEEYDKNTAEYKKKLDAFKDYKKQYRKYEKKLAKIEAKEGKAFEEHNSKLDEYKKYKLELENWEKDHTLPKPVEVAEPVMPAVFEKPVEPAPQEKPKLPPLEPRPPVNPQILLDALDLYSKAVQKGKLQDIREKSELLQTAFENHHQEYKIPGLQQASGEFIEAILEFLSPLKKVVDESGMIHFKRIPMVQVETIRAGLQGTEFEKFTRENAVEDQSMLALVIDENSSSFQEILDENFKLKTINNPRFKFPMFDRSLPKEQRTEDKQVMVHQYTERQQIIRQKNLPDFICVEINRGYIPNQEELLKEREIVCEKRKEMIHQRAQNILKENPKILEDNDEAKALEIALIAATEELKSEKKFPPYPEMEARKRGNKITFPNENHRINFSKPFGLEKRNSEYDYDLYSAVIQGGGARGGHYVATALGNDPMQWYHVNDAPRKVKQNTINEALENNKDGCVFLFKRVKKPAG